MLLILADAIRDELARVLASGDLRDALSNLARAHREGKHIVSGPAALLGRLGEARALAEDVRGTFRQIKLRHLEAATLRASVSHLAVIEPRDGDVREEGNGTQRRYRVPLSYFRDSARSQASRLIAEDRDDARVYQRAADAYLFRSGPKGLTLCLQLYGGGGANTADAVRDHARQGPTVCVVDADYKWSDDEGVPSEGDTAARARQAARELAGEVLCAVHAVPCREVENLFPGELVLDCFVATDRGPFHQRCVRAAELGLLGGGPRVDRLDLKEGLRRRDYEALPDGTPRRRYLARVFAEYRGRAPAPPRGWCEDPPRCSGDDPCECILFEGLGNGLLKAVADRLDTLSLQKIAEHILPSGRPHELAWAAIGRLLFAWGCGYPRTRT
jgi:hypothetical protein